MSTNPATLEPKPGLRPADGIVPGDPLPRPAGAPNPATLDLVLDWVERALVVGFYGWFLARMGFELATGATGSGLRTAFVLFWIGSEGLVFVFVLCRRRAYRTSHRWGDWFLALAGTCMAWLAGMGEGTFSLAGAGVVGEGLQAVLLLLYVMGTLIHLHAKLILRRSFGLVAANRGLKCTGPYRVVRHPMYAGYLLQHIAILAMFPSFWNLAVYALAWGFQVPRLLAEERLLSQDPAYRDYQAAVRSRLIPGVF